MNLDTQAAERVAIIDGLVETLGDLIELRAQARAAFLHRCVASLTRQINDMKSEIHGLALETRVAA